ISKYLKTTGKRFNNLKQQKIHLKNCPLMGDKDRAHTAADYTRDYSQKGLGTRQSKPLEPDLN
ncbi:Uncharacterized protein FKW44_001993, partial [Caligus rogercresseyi]